MSLHDISQKLDEVARGYRLGMEGHGSVKLVQLIEMLLPELTDLPPTNLISLNHLLTQSMEALSRRDYLFVADLLEFPIKDAIVEFMKLKQ
jgi:hypothetical protein